MAKGSRGGKTSGNTASARSTQQTQPQAQPQAQPQVQPQAQPAVQQGPESYSSFTDRDAQALRQAMDANYSDPDVAAAIKMYISNSNPNRDGYSHSQNLNYKLDHGVPLNATEKYIDDNIRYGMHAIGKDSNLVRYAHDDVLQQLGVKDYTKLTQAQLQQRLVGQTGTTTSYLSTTYDGKSSPFAPGQPQGGGREVVLNVRANRNTRMVFGAKKQKEIVLDKGTNFRVVGVHYDGTYAHPRNGGTKPRVVVDIETY